MKQLLIIFLILLIATILIQFFITPTEALALAEQYEDFASMHTILVTVLLGVLYAIAFGLTIPITTILALLAGFLFGFLPAFILLTTAMLIGALSVFYGERLFPHSLCRALVGKDYMKLLEWAKQKPISFMLATRFAPLVPFPLAHLIPAEARVPVQDFIWTTMLGTVPTIALVVAIGSSSRMLAAGEPLMAGPMLLGLVVPSLLVLSILFLSHNPTIKSALQEMRKRHPNQQLAPRETTDA